MAQGDALEAVCEIRGLLTPAGRTGVHLAMCCSRAVTLFGFTGRMGGDRVLTQVAPLGQTFFGACQKPGPCDGLPAFVPLAHVGATDNGREASCLLWLYSPAARFDRTQTGRIGLYRGTADLAKTADRFLFPRSWCCTMKATILGLAIAIGSFGVLTTPALAEPPMTSGSSWFKAPSWSMPTMPWSQPKPAKKKSPSMVSQVNKSTQQGWARTKRALDPSWMMPSSSKSSKAAPTRKQSESGGLFSGWFGERSKKEDVSTVPDFLALPRPK